MNRSKGPVVVLMADDDEDDCLFVKDAFREGRIESDMRFVQDGEALMDYLHRTKEYQKAPCPDLILLDLNMPRKDGREALREIKGHPDLRRIPVVILTTSKDERDIRLCYDIGANSFISKPVTFDKLVQAVRTLGAYWFEISQLPPPREGC